MNLLGDLLFKIPPSPANILFKALLPTALFLLLLFVFTPKFLASPIKLTPFPAPPNVSEEVKFFLLFYFYSLKVLEFELS